MNDVPPQLLESLGTAGLPALLMFLAIRWLVAGNKEERQGNKDLMLMLNQERTDRIEALEGEVRSCKDHIRECDADRHNLRTELLRLAHIHGKGGRSEHMPNDPPTTHFTPQPKHQTQP